MRTPIRLLFQKCSKSVQDKWPKVRVVLVTKTKHVLASLGGTPGAISTIFCVSAQFHPALTCIFQVLFSDQFDLSLIH